MVERKINKTRERERERETTNGEEKRERKDKEERAREYSAKLEETGSKVVLVDSVGERDARPNGRKSRRRKMHEVKKKER